MVNDTTPDGDATYNSSGTFGQRDTYRYPSINNLVTGEIKAVALYLSARKSDDISNRNLSTTLRINSIDYDGDTQAISSSYVYKKQIYPKNPDTGLPWTISQVNTLDAGVKDVS
jgi:hypothetical protein